MLTIVNHYYSSSLSTLGLMIGHELTIMSQYYQPWFTLIVNHVLPSLAIVLNHS